MIRIAIRRFWLSLFWLVPETVLAHASDRAIVVTLPTRYYYGFGALAVLATFAVMLILGPVGKVSAKRICALPRRFPLAATRWIAFIALVALVAVGFFGNRDPLDNLLVLFVWTLLWVGLTLATTLFGNIWSAFTPWIAPVRLVRSLIGRSAEGGLDGLGYWPAVCGLLGFSWFEIVSLAPADPAVLATAVTLYFSGIFALAVYAGDAWLRRGEFLTVFFGFVARIAPVWPETVDGKPGLMLGLPGTRLARMDALPASGVAFVTLVIASLTFDGLSETFRWLGAIGINPLEFPGRSAVVGINTIGLLAMWALTAAAILTAILPAIGGAGLRAQAGRTIVSFLPIAAGYHIAHYLVLLLINGQYALQALSDPFGLGWDLFHVGEHFVSTSFTGTYDSMLIIWNLQSFSIVAGHVIAIVLAHKLSGAGNSWRDVPMMALMVFYTVFGLWLLSTPTGA